MMLPITLRGEPTGPARSGRPDDRLREPRTATAQASRLASCEARATRGRLRMTEKMGAAILCALVAVPLSGGAQAQSVEQFYKGRQMTMVVGTSPGGINDISARFAARYLGQYIPGHPSIVVENQPGAGGIASANRLANVFAHDGSVIAKLERAVPMLAIQGDPNVNFDPRTLTWLGSLSSYAKDAYLMLVMAGNPVRSVYELKEPNKSITLGGDNAASSNLIFATIAKEILGLNIKVVRGYTGAAPMFLAMQRGEIDGQVVGYSSVRTGQRDLWNHNAFRPLVQFGRSSRLAEFPDVPTGRELTKDPAALALLDFAELQFFISLPFAAPPGVPPDRAQALQAAFMDMCKDPAVLADAEKLGIDMSPIDGATVLKSIARAAATPRDVIERYNALAGPDRN
jgi:tripartite-type tricarboxylate transporter receptor subunit TctC